MLLYNGAKNEKEKEKTLGRGRRNKDRISPSSPISFSRRLPIR
jgi:hypothetical protein